MDYADHLLYLSQLFIRVCLSAHSCKVSYKKLVYDNLLSLFVNIIIVFAESFFGILSLFVFTEGLQRFVGMLLVFVHGFSFSSHQC